MIFDKINKEALITDLYEITMIAAYYFVSRERHATFELFFRSLPENRSYMIFSGLEQVLEYLSDLSFSEQEIDYLRSLPEFSTVDDAFYEYLSTFKFTCEVRSVPEGTVVFNNEPFFQVTGPIIEAQIVETFVLAMINFQTTVATKGNRVSRAANGKPVIEFGARRAHSPYAAVLAARASFVGGCAGTSNVYAGYKYGIPVKGTIAHSYVLNFKDELESFNKYIEVFPKNSILLIDTYDIEEGARNAVRTNFDIMGVRIDSGDLLKSSKNVRKILDDAGLKNAKIFGSGDLNEYIIADLEEKGAPYDSFGVGTELVTSVDAPVLSGIYKLVETQEKGERQYKAKFSKDKKTYPGKKNVYRILKNQKAQYDKICLDTEPQPDHSYSLLKTYMDKGQLKEKLPTLKEIQKKCQQSLQEIPDSIIRFKNPQNYRIQYSETLEDLLQNVAQKQLG